MTSPVPSTGSGSVWIASGAPNALRTAAFMETSWEADGDVGQQRSVIQKKFRQLFEKYIAYCRENSEILLSCSPRPARARPDADAGLSGARGIQLTPGALASRSEFARRADGRRDRGAPKSPGEWRRGGLGHRGTSP